LDTRLNGVVKRSLQEYGAAVTYKDIIRLFKTNAAAAEALDVTRATLSNWKNGSIPWGRQCLIQLQTKGALKAKPEFKL
jgi:hypothetical protein